MIFISVLFFACAGDKKSKNNLENTTQFIRQTDGLEYAHFDTLLVAPIFNWSYDNSSIGKRLSINDITCLDTATYFKPRHYMIEEYQFYIVHKIKMSDVYDGIIVRWVFGKQLQYVDLLVIDKTSNKIIDQLRLSEYLGSEGEYIHSNSWVINKKNGISQEIISRKYHNYLLNNDIQVSDSLILVNWKGKEFIQTVTHNLEKEWFRLFE